jgi:hypothetical protein
MKYPTTWRPENLTINLSKQPLNPILNKWFYPSSTNQLINKLKQATNNYNKIFNLTKHLSNNELNKLTQQLTLNNDVLSHKLSKVRHELQHRQKIINSKSFGNYIKEVSEPNYYKDPRTNKIYISTGIKKSQFGQLYKKYKPANFNQHYNELSTNNIATRKQKKGYYNNNNKEIPPTFLNNYF